MQRNLETEMTIIIDKTINRGPSKTSNIGKLIGPNYKVGLNTVVIKTSGLTQGVEFLVKNGVGKMADFGPK